MNNRETDFPIGNRNYKDTLFRLILGTQEAMLSLYNALNGTDYTNAEDLKVVTLENAVYMNMKNDLACVVDCHLNLYEHQSSINPNMPLRDLLYVAKEYEKLFSDKTLYSIKQVKIPAPNFIVFYNGTDAQPERLEMKLSDAFESPVENPSLELKVVQLNINVGYNSALMEKCRPLYEYSQYVECVRKYAKTNPLSTAVELAVKECIKNDILSGFLQAHRAEAISMSIFEYDEEREMALIKKDIMEVGFEEGYKNGHKQGAADGYAQGIEQGIEQTIEQSIRVIIALCREVELPDEYIINKLTDSFPLSVAQARQYISEL